MFDYCHFLRNGTVCLFREGTGCVKLGRCNSFALRCSELPQFHFLETKQ